MLTNDRRTFLWWEAIVLVADVHLVFYEVLALLQLSDVVEVGAHPRQQRIGSNGCCGCFG